MRTLSTLQLLDTWEYGLDLPPAQRALALLEAAWPDASMLDAPRPLEELSVGQRDARLLMIRQRLWGPTMAALAACPRCGEQLELTLDTREMLANAGRPQLEQIPLNVDEYDVIFRLPTTLDFLAAEDESDLEAARSLILKRCLLSAQAGGSSLDSEQLPAEVVDSIVAQMAEADPLADIQLAVACPACDHRWSAAFDIVSFLWAEVEAWACRTLHDVHSLATAYGWSEREILALSPMRRQFYLEMAGA